jgi:hypothetical protein
MKQEISASHATLKEKAVEELKAYWIISIYLAVLLGALTNYRRLILAEFGVAYVHYGIAIIEALIIAKVILIAKALGFGRRYEGGPLIWPVIHKTIFCGLLVMLFGILERIVEGLLHKKDLAVILQGIVDIGADELAARTLLMLVAFVPLFAFWELGRVIGLRKLSAIFFSSHATPPASASGR